MSNTPASSSCLDKEGQSSAGNLLQGAPARKLSANLFLLLVSIYVLTSSGNTVDVTDDAMIRFGVTQSLAERGDFNLSGRTGTRWGIPGQDGRYYAKYGLGYSLLAVPFYGLGVLMGNPKFTISLIGPIALSCACLILFRFSLRLGHSYRTATMLSLAGGLCTQLWPESKSPFDHSLETLFSLLSVYLVYRSQEENSPSKTLILGGLCLGLAVLTRITACFWLLPLAVLLLGRCPAVNQDILRRFTSFVVGLFPFLLLTAWYNQARFGSIWETGYSLWARRERIDHFATPYAFGLAGQLISPGKGVLVYCPILFLCLGGLKSFTNRHRALGVAILVASAGFLSFFAKYSFWHGDIAWGPRFLTVLIPFWLLPLGNLLERRSARGRRLMGVVIAASATLSLLIQLGGVAIDMNLHYLRLLRAGTVENVSTHTYPAKIYFQWRFSPLANRPREIAEAFGLSPAPDSTEREVRARTQEKVLIDFWWVSSAAGGMGKIFVILLMSPFLLEVFLGSLRIRKILRESGPAEPIGIQGSTTEP